jgi:hypothetical protein
MHSHAALSDLQLQPRRSGASSIALSSLRAALASALASGTADAAAWWGRGLRHPHFWCSKRDSVALSVSVVTSVRTTVASVAAAWLPTHQLGVSRLRHPGAPETGRDLPPLQ